MIVITGATGALNGATVEHLLKRIPAGQIGVSVRDTARARHFVDRGVRVRRGSYEDPAALLDSIEGADQVLLVSSNDPGADAVSPHRVGIETAVAAGARRILYTSSPAHQHTGLPAKENVRGREGPGRVTAHVKASPGSDARTVTNNHSSQTMKVAPLMRQVRYDRFDGVDQLWIDEVSKPEDSPGQAVVRVYASCINPGSVPATLHGASYTPIRDLAGVVVSVGDSVQDVKTGDEVLGWSQEWTAHAEYVSVPATQLIAKPAGLSWDVAGSLFITPMAGLAGVTAVEPSEGEVVVVSAATGGVGFTAAQLARRTGATVIGIGSPSKADHMRERGIIPVSFVDDVAENVQKATGGRKIDAFIDAFGSGYVQLALDLGVPPERINTAVDYKSAKEKAVTARGTMDAGGLPAYRMLAELAASGDLAIPIAVTYPLAEVKAAYTTLLAERRPFGRVVLHPQE